MNSIGIVIVTYNRLECLKKNQECINHLMIPENLACRVYIIDNASTDGTKEWLDECIDARTTIIHMKENVGGSGGFSKGVELASKENEYVWGMDDDAYPTQEALCELYNSICKFGEQAAYWSNCNDDESFEEEKSVNDWMFVGFCVPSSIVRKIGPPRNDFFIYFDDNEYAMRIKNSGINIYKIRKSIIIHEDRVTQLATKLIFGKRISIPKLNKWRMYYYARNRILRFPKFSKQYWIFFFFKQPWLLIKTLAVDNSLFKYAFKGYIDGIIGKAGKKLDPKDF